MAAYYATNTYVLSFSRGLARELAGDRCQCDAILTAGSASMPGCLSYIVSKDRRDDAHWRAWGAHSVNNESH